jgi:2,5-diketo-D-gluconate reductase A
MKAFASSRFLLVPGWSISVRSREFRAPTMSVRPAAGRPSPPISVAPASETTSGHRGRCAAAKSHGCMTLVLFAAILQGCYGDGRSMDSCPAKTVELNTGACMPLINLGGYNHSRPSNRTLWLELGGRGFDTCSYISFDEQKAVGDAVAASSIPRDDIFITTKVPCCPNPLWGCEPAFPWARMNATEAVHKAANVSMELLGMDYVDMLLLGTPCDTFENTVAAYRALEELGASGKARAIGISNFDKPLINALLKEVTVTPAVNQCEFSIGFNYTAAAVRGGDPATLKQCQDLGITYSAYSVFGAPPHFDVLRDPDVMAVAAAHNTSTAEIALRWVVQQSVVAVTSSNKESHDRSDLDIFNFSLSPDEMARLTKVKGESGQAGR